MKLLSVSEFGQTVLTGRNVHRWLFKIFLRQNKNKEFRIDMDRDIFVTNPDL